MLFNLQKFCHDYIQFNSNELFEIANLFKPKSIKKEELIYSEGQIINEIYFLNNGIVKSFRNHKNKQIEDKFFFNATFISDLNSIQSQKETKKSLIAITNVEIYVADFEDINLLMQKSEKHKQFFSTLFKDRYLFN